MHLFINFSITVTVASLWCQWSHPEGYGWKIEPGVKSRMKMLWSKISLPSKLRLILEVWRWVKYKKNSLWCCSWCNRYVKVCPLCQSERHFSYIFMCVYMHIHYIWNISYHILLKCLPSPRFLYNKINTLHVVLHAPSYSMFGKSMVSVVLSCT